MSHSEETSQTSLNASEREALRSSIGQTILSPKRLRDGLEDDSMAYLQLIQAADIAHQESACLLQDAVHQARRLNHSWQSIGEVLGVSRQAAQQRFKPAMESIELDESRCRRISGATAFNEMEMLRIEGKAGYHLVGFGPLFLMVQESEQQWEHIRIVAFAGSQSPGQRLTSEGWIYVGAWCFFQYFKRVVGSA